jgi:methyltransferase
MLPLLLAALAFVPMLLEARMASRNDRRLREAGAVEPAGDVYPLMAVAYPACFLAMLGEAWIRGAATGGSFAAGLAVFAAAKALKYWAIATLGRRWSFRVMVLAGAPLVTSGPYRFARHPNYIGVAGELAGMALRAQAPVAGTVALAGFGVLLLARIRVEERALRGGARPGS